MRLKNVGREKEKGDKAKEAVEEKVEKGRKKEGTLKKEREKERKKGVQGRG